jgi:hypothetical protein
LRIPSYRHGLHKLIAEATVNEARLRQLSLLEERPFEPLAKEIEEKAFELLVQLLIAVIPAIEGGRCDEQDHP